MRFTSSSSLARHRLVILSALTIGAVVLRGAQGPAPALARAAMYTEAQATAGESLYRQSCAGCHGATLTGGTAPPLAGPPFETSWSDPRVTAADVFFVLQSAGASIDRISAGASLRRFAGNFTPRAGFIER